MKKLNFILLSLLIYFSSFAQPYKPCLDGEIIKWSFIGPINSAQIGSIDVVAFGDTLLNGISYKKLFLNYPPYDKNYDMETNNSNWMNYVPQLYYQWENSFIRESSDASKLYFYNSFWDEETLISDIDLQEGDIFDYNGYERIVDSVYFKNELKHVCVFGLLTFIESVGSAFGFGMPCWDYCYGINCFQNQTIFYKNNLSDFNFSTFPCGWIADGIGINTASEDNYSVFIQKDQIEIFSTSNINVNISIYDIQGKMWYTKNNISDNKFIIPTSSFPKGSYILNILNKENNKINTKKIIKL